MPSWFAAELSVSEQDGRCKQHGQTATIWLKALFMPRLAICSRDLHWQWINWTLLCDTVEVSMVRLASLAITQHGFQPALTGRPESGPELISRKNCLPRMGTKAVSRWADFMKNCFPRIGSKELPRFLEKYRAHGRKKMWSQHATAIYPIPRYTRPRYIGSTLYCVNVLFVEKNSLTFLTCHGSPMDGITSENVMSPPDICLSNWFDVCL